MNIFFYIFWHRSADRETRWRFNVTVVCSDDGSPAPLTSHKSLAIYVTDANDNRPAFTSQVSVYTTQPSMTSAVDRSMLQLWHCQLLTPEQFNVLKHCAHTNVVTVPRTNTRLGDRRRSVAGPRNWNSLPASSRLPNIEFGHFKRLLKAFLFGETAAH